MAVGWNQLCCEADLLKLRSNPIGGTFRFGALAGIGAHASDAQKLGQVAFKRLAMGLDVGFYSVHGPAAFSCLQVAYNIMRSTAIDHRIEVLFSPMRMRVTP